MEPQVLETELLPLQARPKMRMISAALQALIWMLSMFLWKYLEQRSNVRRLPWVDLFLPGLFGGVIYGVLMYFFATPRFSRRTQGRSGLLSILVQSDQITSAYKSSDGTSWVRQKVIRKGKVRSIFRIPGGIGVSERRQFGARMLGFLAIPNTVPKFEELRDLLESWRHE